MRIVITQALRLYMKEKKRAAVVLDVASSSTGDVEIAEPFCRLARESEIPYLTEKRHFHRMEAEGGAVLLPNYRLRYADTVVFDLKKRLFFHSVVYTGVEI